MIVMEETLLSVLVLYVVALSLSSIILLIMSVTGFGASLEDRIYSGLGALAAGAYAYYLAFQHEGERYFVFYAALFLPAYAGYRVYKGFRTREQDRANRRAAKAATQAADEWRSTRRW